MSTLRGLLSIGAAVVFVSVAGVSLAVTSGAETIDRTAITGAWTLNTDLSDAPPAPPQGDNPENGDGRRGGSGMGDGRRGGGTGRGTGGARMNPEDMARMRDAMHDIMTAPAHLTITQTETMVVITAQDGRTTRLSPDGNKIKDENTGIERKTKWDDVKLVSEISGLGRGKITETYAVDPEHHQLHVTLQAEGGRNPNQAPINRVYYLDAR